MSSAADPTGCDRYEEERVADAWARMMPGLEVELGKPTFESWIRPNRPCVDDDGIVLESPSRMAADWTRKYLSRIAGLFAAEFGVERVEVRIALSPDADKDANVPSEPESESDRQASREREALSRLLIHGGFSEKMIQEADLATLLSGTSEQQATARVAEKFIGHFSGGRPEPSLKRGLMVYGPTGTYKSTAVRAVCKRIALLGGRVLYASCPELERLLKERPDLEESALKADLFAPDDFQRALAPGSPAAVQRFMVRILEHADHDGKPIMVSSSEYGPDVHRTKLPERISGRIEKLFHWQFNDGPNMRTVEDPEEKPWWI